jgi:Na+-translocating ferredoxin:NAD+ oxidoreductase RNF subunit RnfB
MEPRDILTEPHLHTLATLKAEIEISCRKCFHTSKMDAVVLRNHVLARIKPQLRRGSSFVRQSLTDAAGILKCSKCGQTYPKLLAMRR